MKLSYLFVFTALLVDYIHTLSLAASEENRPFIIRNDKTDEAKVTRTRRAALLKLPLLAGAAVIGKKALLLGGATVGAKALVGAGILGAGLYKANYYGGGYGGGYGNYYYVPSAASSWV
ncbi:hypothetical protein QLX08_011359 [Tetragonisca angustula]|uniref:Uncharacterized protein n=1 Tax=Tetragonisca angustula TaxID=166442 RepID=A0AAW0Z888_9HYME